MRARSFSHVGLTVSDFNKAVRFYADVFGCPLVGVADEPPPPPPPPPVGDCVAEEDAGVAAAADGELLPDVDTVTLDDKMPAVGVRCCAC